MFNYKNLKHYFLLEFIHNNYFISMIISHNILSGVIVFKLSHILLNKLVSIFIYLNFLKTFYKIKFLNNYKISFYNYFK